MGVERTLNITVLLIKLAKADKTEQCEVIANLKFNKLLYFTQVAILQCHGPPCSTMSWKHEGKYAPVVPQACQKFKEFSAMGIFDGAQPFDLNACFIENMEILADIYRVLRQGLHGH